MPRRHGRTRSTCRLCRSSCRSTGHRSRPGRPCHNRSNALPGRCRRCHRRCCSLPRTDCCNSNRGSRTGCPGSKRHQASHNRGRRCSCKWYWRRYRRPRPPSRHSRPDPTGRRMRRCRSCKTSQLLCTTRSRDPSRSKVARLHRMCRRSHCCTCHRPTRRTCRLVACRYPPRNSRRRCSCCPRNRQSRAHRTPTPHRLAGCHRSRKHPRRYHRQLRPYRSFRRCLRRRPRWNRPARLRQRLKHHREWLRRSRHCPWAGCLPHLCWRSHRRILGMEGAAPRPLDQEAGLRAGSYRCTACSEVGEHSGSTNPWLSPGSGDCGATTPEPLYTSLRFRGRAGDRLRICQRVSPSDAGDRGRCER